MNRLRLALATSLLALGSCLTSSPMEWSRSEVPLCSTSRLYEIARMGMERDDFILLERRFDPTTRTLVSAWDVELHPFKGHGYRERAHVRYEAGVNPGKLLLSVRVEREINDNLAKPLDPQYADWKEDADNKERARVLLQYIRSILGTEFEVGKQGGLKEEEKEYGKW